MPGLDAPSLLAIQQKTIQTAARVSFTPWDWKLVMRRLLITNLSHMRRSDCNLPLKDKKSSVNLCGDGRFDSPGHNAKYGTYSLMDEATGNIIDFLFKSLRFRHPMQWRMKVVKDL